MCFRGRETILLLVLIPISSDSARHTASHVETHEEAPESLLACHIPLLCKLCPRRSIKPHYFHLTRKSPLTYLGSAIRSILRVFIKYSPPLNNKFWRLASGTERDGFSVF